MCLCVECKGLKVLCINEGAPAGVRITEWCVFKEQVALHSDALMALTEET